MAVKTTRSVSDALFARRVVIKSPEGTTVRIPCGMLVWAAGNTSRPLSRDLMSQLSKAQTERRGIKVDGE